MIDLPRGPDGKRKQKWIALPKDIRTKRDAEAEAHKLAVKRDEGELTDDRRMTVAQLLDRWWQSKSDDWAPSTRHGVAWRSCRRPPDGALSSAGWPSSTPALVLGMTGLRRGELLALRWRNVDLERGVIHVEEALIRVGRQYGVSKPKTKKGIRDVPIPSVVVSALRVHREEQQKRREEAGPAWVDRDLVFDNGLGDYWLPTTFTDALNRAARRAGYHELTPHVLRHGCASIVYDQTGDLKLVQELLGHSTLAVTADIYTHMFEAKKRKAAEGIEAIFTATGTDGQDE
nr:MAG: hypothetical protein DIU55_11710 [Bacillota bacterium]